MIRSAALLAFFLCVPLLADELEPVDPVATGSVDPAAETWLRVLYHAHSALGTWTYGPGEAASADPPMADSDIPRLLVRGKAAGFDAMVFTEHNTIAHYARFRSREADPSREALLLYGVEYSGKRGLGHAGLVYAPRADDDAIRPGRTDRIDVEEYRAAIAATHDRGGFAVVNHPLNGLFPWPDESTLGADAIEIFRPDPTSLARTLAWWQDRLRVERRAIDPISGADYHPFVRGLDPAILRGYANLVRVDARTPDGVLEGLRHGRIVAYRHWPTQETGELPVAWLAAGSDLSARIGDEVVVDEGSPVFQIHVQRAEGWRVRVFDETSAEPVAQFEPTSSDEVRAFRKTLPGEWGFVRVEIRRPVGYEQVATGLVTFRRRD